MPLVGLLDISNWRLCYPLVLLLINIMLMIHSPLRIRQTSSFSLRLYLPHLPPEHAHALLQSHSYLGCVTRFVATLHFRVDLRVS